MKRAKVSSKRAIATAVATLLGLLVVAAPAAFARHDGRNPLEGIRLWNGGDPRDERRADPNQSFWRAALDLERAGNRVDAERFRRIARQPMGLFFGNWNGVCRQSRPGALCGIEKTISQRSYWAELDRSVPLLATYALPNRVCKSRGSYYIGGFRHAADFRRWIDAYARGLGRRRAVVIVEPDSIADMHCMPRGDIRARQALLRYAVDRLQRNGRVSVYLDAGYSTFRPAREMASLLLGSGVSRARGFFVNVFVYNFTQTELRYCEEISAILRRTLGSGRHCVINTSRNGNGPLPRSRYRFRNEGTCNPPGRAIGEPPTTKTASEWADAYLWIWTPGASDGGCHPGDPIAGRFFLRYALQLARNARF